MSIKGGGLLLVLAVPLVGYVAWQVKGVTRADLIASEAPPDKGPTKEQLTATRTGAAAAAEETRKVVEVTWQYSADAPKLADPAAAAVANAAARRAVELAALDAFLAGTDKPEPFKGSALEEKYTDWASDRATVQADEERVKKWFSPRPVIRTAADAERELTAVTDLIDRYSARSKFADRSKAVNWRLDARLHVITELTAVANAQYASAIEAKLPLKPATFKTVSETLDRLQKEIARVRADKADAETQRLAVDPTLAAKADDTVAVAAECAARAELLDLLANPKLFTDATGVAAWLKKVDQQYAKTNDAKVRALIRDKVQEFCDAFIPPVAALDAEVLWKKMRVKRLDVTVEYFPKPGAAKVKVIFEHDPEGLNEFTIPTRLPKEGTEVRAGGAPGRVTDVQPTDKSEAALMYNAARKAVTKATTAPRWNAESVEALKKACNGKDKLIDQLEALDNTAVGAGPQIWTRLEGLAAGVAACKNLFRPAQ